MRSPRSRLLLLLLLGVVVFAGGVSVAFLRLPEWRNRDVPDAALFEARTRETARRAGFAIESIPRVQLSTYGWLRTSSNDLPMHEPAYEVLGARAVDWLAAEGRGPFVLTVARARWPGGVEEGELQILFSTHGAPVAASWMPQNVLRMGPQRRGARGNDNRALRRILVPEAATLPEKEIVAFAQTVRLAEVAGTSPPETLLLIDVGDIAAPSVHRLPGSADWWRGYLEQMTVGSLLWRAVPRVLVVVILTFATIGTFIVLLARRRIELSKGAILAAVSIVLSIGTPIRDSDSWLVFVNALFSIIGKALLLFVLWSTAESCLRSMIPGLRTSLDTLRAGRLGPNGGRALAGGWALGAIAGGLTLAALALALMTGVVAPTGGSVRLPLFGVSASPIDEGAIRAGLVLLAICAAMRLPLIRRMPGAATLLAALALATRIPLSSFWMAAAVALAIAFVLVRGYAAYGLTALVAASFTSTILPPMLFSLLHASWLTPSAVLLVAAAAAPLAFGIIGLRRPAEVEEGPHAAPAFVRRLEAENRLKHEMDLLARMQLGLLPQQMPSIAGWEIAARSILATEAGGDLYDFLEDADGKLWIAAGDVSGHGYSCAIAQAMTKAGLASLVEADRTPAMILGRLDRVLRGIGSARTFTTLALLRLDPVSGEALIANAGHPYPWIAAAADVREIELPSLPLGQGPPRNYADTPLTLDRGATLVLSSDGLFEAPDANGRPYGFERLRPLLRKVFARPAEAILEAIVADWREHAGSDAPPDDTTIVVVKRKL
ncbi:MAG TPA: PP2C family protein-serine/threonine phosphatase [Thermoanaerobaculia bacterium]|nr:PP2C family protein-serine/threonine phosphatase [Thermoanaerobaculia bacterium]